MRPPSKSLVAPTARVGIGLLAAGALTVTPGLALPTAQAAPVAWGPTVHVSHGVPIGPPDVAVGPHGGITVVWTGAAAGSESPDVRSRRRTAAGTWQPVERLGLGGGAHVATDGAGTAVAVWLRQRRGLVPEVVTARRPVSGRWSTPVVLSRAARDTGVGTGPQGLRLAVSAGGAAVAAWRWGSEEGGPAVRVQAAYRPARGAWQRGRDLTTPRACDRGVATAIGPGGRAVVVCVGGTGGVRVVRQVAGRWPAPVLLPGTGNSNPDVAVGPAGRTVAVWSHLVPADDEAGVPRSFVVQSARLLSRGWSAPQRLSATGEENHTPLAWVAAGGATTVVWAGTSGRLQARERPSGSAPYGPTRTVAPDVAQLSPLDLAGNVDGDVVVVWARSAPGGLGAETAAVTHPARGAWTDPVVLDDSGAVQPSEEPTGAAMGRCGRAVVAWRATRTELRRAVGCG